MKAANWAAAKWYQGRRQVPNTVKQYVHNKSL
jgi:hypothetical protein